MLRNRSAPVRGQALVMFAMFLLVLVLLVMATLSLSHLTHQKMEMQVASDAAAYSQAVATARAYNSVALLNRAQVATMVALTGVDSAVSFAGSYRAALNATWYSYWDEFDAEYCGGAMMPNNASFPTKFCEGVRSQIMSSDCPRAAHGMDAIDRNFCYGESCRIKLEITGYGAYGNAGKDELDTARLPLVYKEFERVKGIWQALDDAAGMQARSVQSEASAYHGLQAAALGAAQAKLAPFTAASLASTGATSNAGALGVANREFSTGYGAGITDNSIDAAMGSRAHTFITRRADGARAIQSAIRTLLGPSGGANEVTINAMKGNGYFATTQNHGARPATSFAVWGDEECSVTVNYAGPKAQLGNPGAASGNLKFEGWVGSTDKQNTTDMHNWCPGDFKPDDEPPDERHTMLPHSVPASGFDPCAASSCIWPNFIDTNAGPLADPGDVFGQPKLFAAASKDLSTQADPWNLFFNFKFRQQGNGETTNFKQQHAVSGVQPSMQSLAAAMAYYHRPGHWKEPPNLFNPYWRATLVRANVDSTWRGDIGASVSAGNNTVLSDLLAVGYAGIP